MIESAEEFKRLRESDIPEEYHRAAHEEAGIEVWENVLAKYPGMAFWVVQNKTVPVSILEGLAKHRDSQVKDMVARKRKIPESLMLVLSKDEDWTVRMALTYNGKVTERVLNVLVSDDKECVRVNASEKLQALTSKG